MGSSSPEPPGAAEEPDSKLSPAARPPPSLLVSLSVLAASLGTLTIAFAGQGGWGEAGLFLLGTLGSGLASFACVWLLLFLSQRRARQGQPQPDRERELATRTIGARLRALPLPSPDHPAGHLEPLAPDERILWVGRARPRPGRVFFQRYRLNLAFALAGLLVYGCWALFLFGSGSIRQVHAQPLLLFATAMLSLSAPVFFASLALAWSAHRARRYVLTTQRGLVVDPTHAYAFTVDPSSARVEGHKLCFDASEPELVALGRYPWSLPVLQGNHVDSAVFEELEAPLAVLAELRLALEGGEPRDLGPPGEAPESPG